MLSKCSYSALQVELHWQEYKMAGGKEQTTKLLSVFTCSCCTTPVLLIGTIIGARTENGD